MKIRFQQKFQLALLLICLGAGTNLLAQITPGVYMSTEDTGDQALKHKITVSEIYMVHTAYGEDPPKFKYTHGGYYKETADGIELQLEFNSQFEIDGIKKLNIPFRTIENGFILGEMEYSRVDGASQELDGHWLFATRGPDTGQERRDDSNTRKTLKILGEGSFQWIAYNTESFKFFGTGGGSFTSSEGTYVEHIEFFSRDDSRVGAQLEFKYEVKGDDWHHTGNNSRGEPMYEIWSRR